MAASSNTDAIKKLAALQVRFKQNLPDRLSELENLWETFCQDTSKGDDLASFHHIIHNLAGSGGTYGAMAISTVAREMDVLLKDLQKSHDPSKEFSESVIEKIDNLIVNLKQIAEEWQPSEIPYLLPSEPKQQRDNNLIYLAEDDEVFADSLITKLKQANYQVHHFVDLSEFEAACDKQLPAAIVMDVVFKEGDIAGANVITRISSKIEKCPPVIFISVRDDIEVRLAVARAGANRYFCKPLDINKFMQTLDGLTARVASKPYKVLLIDDDETLLEYYATVLREAGIEVKALSNPLLGLEVLEEFNPDIIVTDVYMPGCSGPELAQVIRQDDVWALMPIMFLSMEDDINRQLAAMNLGGDDFLVKPVSADHLVAAVVARAKRARWTSRLNKDLENSVRESEFQLVTMNQHDVVCTLGTDRTIKSVNEKFNQISGYGEEGLVGKNYDLLKSEHHPSSFYAEMWDCLSRGKIWRGTICNRNKKGEDYWVDSTIVPFLNDKGKPYKYVAVQTDITELIKAKEEAENANRAKSKFLSSMSHELRTPMNAIMGFGQLLKIRKDCSLTQAQTDDVNEILKAGKHLLDLINEILDLARIEAGRIDLSIETVELNEIIDSCIQLIKPLTEKDSIEISLSQEGTITDTNNTLQNQYVRADQVRLKQVLLNLLSNAIKYNSKDGKVTIDISSSTNSQTCISVSDTGSGIPIEHQTRLFQPFSRLGLEKSEVEGTGIGLVITKNIVELMGGTIGVDSHPGKGSRFWIELPSDSLSPLINNGTQASDVSSLSPDTITEIERTILYIEDNPANLRLVNQLLSSKTGLHMWTAHEPALGLELAFKNKPDVILLDINLPGMDGYDVLKQLRKNDYTKNTPVIAISANAMKDDIDRGISAGFDFYATKPINVEFLLNAIDKALSQNTIEKKSASRA